MDSIAKILLRKSRASDPGSARSAGGGVAGGTGGGTGGGGPKGSSTVRAKMEVAKGKTAAAKKVPAKAGAKRR